MTSFEFSGTGESVGSIVPLPGIPTKVERGGDWTLQRLEREVARPVAGAHRRAVGPVGRGRGGGAAADPGRRARHHDPARRRRRGRQVGDRPRVPADPRRARRPRLLLAPLEDLHGRALRRARAAELGQQLGRRHPDHAHHPDRRPVGAAADPRASASTPPRRERRRVPPHRHRADGARRRCRRRRRPQRAGVDLVARRPPLRHAHGVGARVDVVHLLRRVDPGRRAASRPRGVDPARHAPVRPDGRLRGRRVTWERRLVGAGATGGRAARARRRRRPHRPSARRRDAASRVRTGSSWWRSPGCCWRWGSARCS